MMEIVYIRNKYKLCGSIFSDENDIINLKLNIFNYSTDFNKSEICLYKVDNIDNDKKIYKKVLSSNNFITYNFNLKDKGNYYLLIKESNIDVINIDFSLC